MGRKSRTKKEMRLYSKANITFHQWQLEGTEYAIQEIHPQDPEPSTEDMMQGMSLIAKTGHETFDLLLKEFIKAFPSRRFYVVAPKEFVIGVTPIIIATYPEPTEGQDRRIKEAIESIKKQKGLT